ncbi:hypothetical protein [Pseudonocardia kunmingensis]|uniref:Chromosome segregation ATPase n=1 Tax=Pseudonocardia kunmingensis TaxID=630975 RepID=A0A543DWK6_9PSEU|nr:hypothetical protein [Pseudonocardia kunmingensis]TQM13727.1 hypothetical protein FB558_0480 [Pseudonocardia kunmingensis]
MYELARVRLFSVGPPGARYSDVTLDLRGVGPAVRGVAAQADLFAPDDLERVPRRPSPASVLFLENGGGKSVLLKLVFSVLLPGRRQVVGTTSTTVLEKFVLGEDVAHVVLEWMHTRTGQLLVTGKVSEWRGHVTSSDPEKLGAAWYSFRPGAGFGLDELPFTVDGRRVTTAGFKDRVQEEHRRRPALELVWETGPRDWTRHLADAGLDPELFRYQRAMNAGEGEAAEAFAFPSDEAFVDFLLRAVLDPDEPQNLADLVAGYATRLAQRADLEHERDFVEGTLARLGPLTGAERAAAAARDGEATAQAGARTLAAAIAARRAAEDERAGAAAAAHADAQERVRGAEAEERRRHGIATELRRRVALLELAAAQDAEAAARRAHDEAERQVAGWQAVEPLLRHQVAEAEARRLRGVVDAEQERARPALRARQDAARALAAGLRAMAGEADAAAGAAEEAATAADGRADAARAAELAEAGNAATHAASAEQARGELARVERATATAVTAGHLREGEDVAAAGAAAEAEAGSAAEELAALHAELTELRRARRGADERRSAARRADDAARAAAERAESVLAAAMAARDALAGEGRLADLLGVEEIRPDTDASALEERLGAAIGAGDRRRTELLAAQERDTRALRALGDGGLLPEPAEIEQVLGVLEAAGITAYSGWRYLTMLDGARRASVVARLPHLVSGVLLNNPGDAPRAREELERARLLPCAAVAVGATAAVAEEGAAPGVDFVVPPNPAMLDEAAAEQVRVELDRETRDRAEALETLGAALDADRALLARLQAWRAQHPVGELDALGEAAESARTAVAATAREADAADAEITALDDRADRLEQEAPLLDAAAASARARAAALAAVLAEVRRRPELDEQVRAATAGVERAEAGAARARGEAAAARREAEEARRRRDRQRTVADNSRTELADLPVDGADIDAEADGPAADAPALGVLRAEYRNAEAAYAAAEVDADLRGRLGEAERAARAAHAAIEELPDAARAVADALLRSPDAADPASRRSATAQARDAFTRCAEQLREAAAELALAKKEAGRFTAPTGAGDGPIEPYGEPEDVEHGRELVERAEQDARSAAARTADARAAAAAAESAHRAAESSAQGFRHVVAGLDDAFLEGGAEPGYASPFPDDVDAALARWKDARAAVRDAARVRAAADKEVRSAVDAVAQFAQEARFSGVTSPVRSHLLGVARTDMPGLAGDWERALRPRLRSLEDDLANIGRHRSGIVTRLQGMVGEALRTLRLAQRLSELPDGLSDWSGQQFLRIRFDELTDAALLHELGEVVDRTAHERSGTARERRDGMSLLLRGVRAAMPKGVRVEMLKPDAVLRTERLRVSEIRDVFSGGQQLTAAIVLYCTMAALRAHQRGQGRRPHAGVLFLDNPIGRASAGYLLELQFGVARALGVQLIYTTGLFDAGALSAFPLIIRLRNDADLRAGRKYLSVDDRVARRLTELGAPDGTGQVAATRVFRRPEPVAP